MNAKQTKKLTENHFIPENALFYTLSYVFPTQPLPIKPPWNKARKSTQHALNYATSLAVDQIKPLR